MLTLRTEGNLGVPQEGRAFRYNLFALKKEGQKGFSLQSLTQTEQAFHEICLTTLSVLSVRRVPQGSTDSYIEMSLRLAYTKSISINPFPSA